MQRAAKTQLAHVTNWFVSRLVGKEKILFIRGSFLNTFVLKWVLVLAVLTLGFAAEVGTRSFEEHVKPPGERDA